MSYNIPVIEIRETERFSEWLHKLREVQAKARIAARVRRLAFGSAGGLSGKALANSVSITGRAIECISSNAEQF